MIDWKRIAVTPVTTIRETLQIIDSGAMQIALVVDTENHLLGTVTDGDIRRGILKEIQLDEPVERIMNPHPTVARSFERRDIVLAIMKLKRLNHIPVIDDDGRIIQVETLQNLINMEEKENLVVLMAGGLGSRLRPLTDECPKPLLKVGGKPVLETILENFMEYGFRRFYLSVNYRADMIRDYFGDGSRWGVLIDYIHEDKRLGTAGALSLLPEATEQPLLVMNGDLLTKVNFQQLIDFHSIHQAQATMCVREYNFQVPYGVVKIEQDRLTGIDEKPVKRFFVNAGIYVLDPKVLRFIPPGEFFDMPNLFKKIIDNNGETTAFPIREYWMDIGQMNDYERANGEFGEVFG
ncbi:nucleotidyl transferase [Lucifera butyrica]|uniref:Nucleotidyl transferase n=1 Tax=Lucifera butyrica TaxID=1351585 RepID=A0A498R5K7_9FIRM|nr:nucleotidyltransferase family protein [Lucifera butyrica]VBB05532.1 nucleotidyl transferase [Lucifera butyrica]